MKWGLFMSSRAAMVKKCTKERERCFVNLHLLLFWHFSLLYLSWHLKLPNIKTRGGTESLGKFLVFECPMDARFSEKKMFILTCWFRVAGLRVDVEAACSRSWGREDSKKKKNRGDKRKGNWEGKVRVSFSLLFPLFSCHFHFDHSSQPKCLLKPSLSETEIRWKYFKNTQAWTSVK